MSEGLFWAALVFLGVGLAHLDDRSPAHVRMGWAAFILGVLLLVGAFLSYVLVEHDDDKPNDDGGA